MAKRWKFTDQLKAKVALDALGGDIRSRRSRRRSGTLADAQVMTKEIDRVFTKYPFLRSREIVACLRRGGTVTLNLVEPDLTGAQRLPLSKIPYEMAERVMVAVA